MTRKKKKKNAQNTIVGSDFEEHRKMVGKMLYAKGKSIIKKSKEVIKTDARTIIREARQAKEAMKKKKPLAAVNGIKDLKIDSSRIMDFLKDIKFKESPSESKKSKHHVAVKHDSVKPITEQKNKSKEVYSYYNTWYNLIISELNRKQ